MSFKDRLFSALPHSATVMVSVPLIGVRYGWLIFSDNLDCSDCTGGRISADEIATVSKKPNVTEILESEMESTVHFAYPNPTSNRFFIKNANGKINSISVTDANGHIVLKQNKTDTNRIEEEISTTQLLFLSLCANYVSKERYSQKPENSHY